MASLDPIPTRFDEQTVAGISELVARTGLKQSEIIRRLVDFALQHADRTGDISFLFNNPRASVPLAALAETKSHYGGKTRGRKPKTKRQTASAEQLDASLQQAASAIAKGAHAQVTK